MINLKEYQSANKRLSDYLPWACLIGPGLTLNKDGSFQRTAMFRGPDLDSTTQTGLVAVCARINNALKRFGSGWALYFEAVREPATDYPTSEWRDPVGWLIDEERRGQFSDAGALYESAYYVTFAYLPPADAVGSVEDVFIETPKDMAPLSIQDQLNRFVSETDKSLDLFASVLPEARFLTDDETLTYLQSTISPKRHPVKKPNTPAYLDSILGGADLVGGLEPMLGEHHLRVLTIMGFPSTTEPGLLDDLNCLGFSYRWMTRFLPMDKPEATKVLTRYRRQWFAKRKSFTAIVKEVMTNEASSLVDSDADNKALDADAALQSLGEDHVAYGYLTTSIVVHHQDANAANEHIRAIERVINGRGYVTIKETVNAVDAWLGSLPGQAYANVRQPIVHTLNLAHMMPLSATWAGPQTNDHLNGPPLIHATTGTHTPFRLVTHQGDVGHTLIVGPTGAGKSVLLSLIAAQFRRYSDAQVFIFDKGCSAMAVTAAFGGDHYKLGEEKGSRREEEDWGEAAPGIRLAEPRNDDFVTSDHLDEREASFSFQPLSRIDLASEQSWAQDWLCSLLAHEGAKITPEVKEAFWSALISLSSAPIEERTLTGLSMLLQSGPLKQALQPYTLAGAHGALLDADSETLASSDWQCFEMEALMHQKALVLPVLTYLFHRLEARFDGKPTLLILDEAWVFLDDQLFAGRIREWLKVLRKKNVSVIFATQSLSDIASSSIAPALIESCPSRIFLPNDRALEPQQQETYAAFGLNGRQIQIIAQATPKQDYYFQSCSGNRLFDLNLGPIALAFCAASSKADLRLIDDILDTHGDEFAAAWLHAKGLDWAADLLPKTAPSDLDQNAHLQGNSLCAAE
jgi:type IV secretion system protein VirB4